MSRPTPSPRRMILLALAIIAVAQSASAQPFTLRRGFSFDPTQVITETRVRLSDLDLTTAAGTQVLRQRIEAAADAVCGAQDAVTPAQEAALADCRRMAVSRAVTRMSRLSSRGGTQDLVR